MKILVMIAGDGIGRHSWNGDAFSLADTGLLAAVIRSIDPDDASDDAGHSKLDITRTFEQSKDKFSKLHTAS